MRYRLTAAPFVKSRNRAVLYEDRLSAFDIGIAAWFTAVFLCHRHVGRRN